MCNLAMIKQSRDANTNAFDIGLLAEMTIHLVSARGSNLQVARMQRAGYREGACR